MALRKPSDFFEKNKEENNNIPVVETDNSLCEELSKVESLTEQLSQLQQELTQKVVQTDLEKLVLSQINTMQENFAVLQEEFQQSNERDISKFRETVFQLGGIVGNLVENEIPKYKKQITSTDIRIGEKFNEFKEVVEENIADIREDVEIKVQNIASAIDDNLEYFNQHLQETSSGVKKTVDTYNKLSKIVESRIEKENDQLEEYSKIIQSLHESFIELEASLQEEVSVSQQQAESKFETYKEEIVHFQNNLSTSIDNRLENYQKELKDVKADVVIAEQHIKNVDKYLKENHQELIELREEVLAEIEKLPLGDVQENVRKLERKLEYIEEVYKNIEPEVIVKEVIQEGILNEPPDTKNSDPLTPLDQNFVTLDQLQQHYRLFINRIQQQLATIGGGGETRLEFLDDVDRNSAKVNGNVLQYDATVGKFIGTSYVPGGSGAGGTSYWVGTNAGIYTTGNVAIGTDVVSSGSTVLWVEGDARITGILSVGQGTVTIDGITNTVSVDNLIVGTTLTGPSGVGYASEGYVDNLVAISTFSGDYNDLANQPSIPSIVGLASEGYVDNLVALKANIDNASFTGITTTQTLNVGVGGTIITTTGIGSVGIGSTQPIATLDVNGDVNITGIVTATSYTGSGVNLSGIVTSIVAGTNITISGSSGEVTINSSGGGGESISPFLLMGA